jgi:hypothetical protein
MTGKVIKEKISQYGDFKNILPFADYRTDN